MRAIVYIVRAGCVFYIVTMVYEPVIRDVHVHWSMPLPQIVLSLCSFLLLLIILYNRKTLQKLPIRIRVWLIALCRLAHLQERTTAHPAITFTQKFDIRAVLMSLTCHVGAKLEYQSVYDKHFTPDTARLMRRSARCGRGFLSVEEDFLRDTYTRPNECQTTTASVHNLYSIQQNKNADLLSSPQFCCAFPPLLCFRPH